METHEDILGRTCRLCGGRKKVNYPFILYSRQIQRDLGVDITGESPAVYPGKICVICERSMQGLDKGFKLVGCLPEFRTHSENNCFCVLHPKQHGIDKTVWSVIKINILAAMEGATQGTGLKCFNREGGTDTYGDFLKLSNGTYKLAKQFWINRDGEWSVSYQEYDLNDHTVLECIPKKLDENDVVQFVSTFNSIKPCKGIDDYDNLMNQAGNTNVITNQNGDILANIESADVYPRSNLNTIRSINCFRVFVEDGVICKACDELKRSRTLYKKNYYMEKRCSEVTPIPDFNSVKNDCLTRSQLIEKVKHYQKETRNLKGKLSTMKKYVFQDAIEKEDVQLRSNGVIDGSGNHLGDICTNIMKNNATGLDKDTENKENRSKSTWEIPEVFKKIEENKKKEDYTVYATATKSNKVTPEWIYLLGGWSIVETNPLEELIEKPAQPVASWEPTSTDAGTEAKLTENDNKTSKPPEPRRESGKKFKEKVLKTNLVTSDEPVAFKKRKSGSKNVPRRNDDD